MRKNRSRAQGHTKSRWWADDPAHSCHATLLSEGHWSPLSRPHSSITTHPPTPALSSGCPGHPVLAGLPTVPITTEPGGSPCLRGAIISWSPQGPEPRCPAAGPISISQWDTMGHWPSLKAWKGRQGPEPQEAGAALSGGV